MLELRGLRKSYGSTVALDGISFEVPDGKLLGFVGPNGAGKTTAMRIVIGVLAADAGDVLSDGEILDPERRRRIGYMPEERGLYPKMRVRDQLRYFAELRGLDRAAASASTERWLDRLGISDRAGDPVEELSLGNQQRVQLVAALVHDPEILVLDEPFSGLDPGGVEVLAEVLVGEARERSLPVIFSSHQLELVERICDRVAIINDGRLIASGDVETLRDQRSANQWRVELEGGSTGWADGIAGVSAAGDGVYELADGVDPQGVLDRARLLGSVHHFSPHRPTLAELFKEAVGRSPTDAVDRGRQG